MIKKPIIIFIALLLSLGAMANVSLPAIFGDHMVLKQNSTITIWGWGKPSEIVHVTPSWNNVESKVNVGNDGNWQVDITTPAAGGPYEIVVQGWNRITISDVLIGEVWVCSGQSNMEWTARNGINDAKEHTAKATNKELRLFSVTHRAANHPNYDIDGRWVVCSPEAMFDFSAIGYFFGDKLQKELNIPVGMINTSWGGTPIEVWTPAQKIENDPVLKEAATKVPEMSWSPNKPGVIYNAMIAPFTRFAISGALWYQGESNVDYTAAYAKSLETLIASWREAFNINFPFIYAQIAPYDKYAPNVGVEIRDAQRRVAGKVDNVAMLTIGDIGDTIDIHPRKKYEAGLRFAAAALNLTYNKKEFAYSGPQVADAVAKGSIVTVSFNECNKLHFNVKKQNYFEVAGADGVFQRANATIKGNKVVLTSKVKNPQSVRFEWLNSVIPTLYNEHNLPASSFKIDVTQ